MKPHCEKSGILRFRTIPEPLVRLFCFPYAGAGASIFRAWSKEFPAYVDVCGVQPPGKEERFSEMPARNMAVLLEGLAKSIVSECEIPFVFFGYSMGALLAFELARLFRRMERMGPFLLAVAASRAPHVQRKRPRAYDLPDEEFLQVIRDLGGTTEDVLTDKEVVRLLFPVLRADFKIVETYRYHDDEPLSIPIVSFHGTKDTYVAIEEHREWQRQTRSGFAEYSVSGDHFFINSNLGFVTKLLLKHINSLRLTPDLRMK